nr:unnamed protein product [Spirometra erinaceieuropaei]
MTVPENLPVDVIIAEIDALDPDAGPNGSVVCVLPSEVFSIRPWQPEPVTLFGAADGKSTLESDQYIKYHVYLSEPIDFERQQFFRLILTCHDSGTPFQRSTRSVINVFVSDENDNPPVLGNPEVIKPAWKMEEIVLDSWKGGHTELMKSMKEILSTNTLLICVPKQLKINETFLRIPATDRDSENNAKLAFQIAVFEQMGSEDESQNAELFDADALTGHVYLKRSLDFMQQTRLLKIILTVWDLGFPSLNSTAHFYILITDENLNAPSIKIFNFGLIGSLSPFQEVNVSSGPNDTIPNIPFYIPKSKKFGMAIGQVQGTDRDSGIAGAAVVNIELYLLLSRDVIQQFFYLIYGRNNGN